MNANRILDAMIFGLKVTMAYHLATVILRLLAAAITELFGRI